MPSHHPESSFRNGVSRSNLFVESDPQDDPRPAPAAARASDAVGARGLSAARERRRGLVVPVLDGNLSQGAARGVADVACFMRSSTSVGGLVFRVRRHVRRAAGNAQRLLGRVAARPHGALSALIAVAALVLAVNWLGCSLRAAAVARDHAEQQQRAASVAFEQAHRRLDTLTAQPVRGAGPAGAARRQQAAAAAAVATWRPRSIADRRRHPRARHRHHR
jgi:hypothetical protein